LGEDGHRIDINSHKAWAIAALVAGVVCFLGALGYFDAAAEMQISAHGFKEGIIAAAREMLWWPLMALLFGLYATISGFYQYRRLREPLLSVAGSQSRTEAANRDKPTSPQRNPLTLAEIWRENPHLNVSARERIRKKLEYRAAKNPALSMKVKGSGTEFENAYSAQLISTVLDDERKTHGESSP
jgi:hypothetical protein